MYSELTQRVLVGGFVSSSIDPDYLIRAGVTHLVNASDKPVHPIVGKQFCTIELRHATWDGSQRTQYWSPLFSCVKKALRPQQNKIYFHVTPEVPTRPASPVAVYAGLRALGYGAGDSRRRIAGLHPVLNWHEISMRSVDRSFDKWSATHRVTRIKPAPELRETCAPIEMSPTRDLVEILDEIFL